MTGMHASSSKAFVLALALLIFGLAGWATGAQENNPREIRDTFTKKTKVESTVSAWIMSDGMKVMVSSTWPSTMLWLSLDAADGSLEHPDFPQRGKALASIRAYTIETGKEQIGVSEVSELGKGIVLSIESGEKKIEGLIFYVPGSKSSYLILTNPKKGYRKAENGFDIEVEEFGSGLMRIRFYKWPAGDPRIYDF